MRYNSKRTMSAAETLCRRPPRIALTVYKRLTSQKTMGRCRVGKEERIYQCIVITPCGDAAEVHCAGQCLSPETSQGLGVKLLICPVTGRHHCNGKEWFLKASYPKFVPM